MVESPPRATGSLWSMWSSASGGSRPQWRHLRGLVKNRRSLSSKLIGCLLCWRALLVARSQWTWIAAKSHLGAGFVFEAAPFHPHWANEASPLAYLHEGFLIPTRYIRGARSVRGPTYLPPLRADAIRRDLIALRQLSENKQVLLGDQEEIVLLSAPLFPRGFHLVLALHSL